MRQKLKILYREDAPVDFWGLTQLQLVCTATKYNLSLKYTAIKTAPDDIVRLLNRGQMLCPAYKDIGVIFSADLKLKTYIV